jgi:transposase
MMGESEGQPTFYYNMSLEQFVPQDHPLRAIRPFIDKHAIRRECRSLYSSTGRPSIPPEQLFLALVGGYLMGITSDRKLIMELQCNMALRWFVGLGLEEQPWDASTFSQNRRRRFDRSGVLERLFDQTVKRAMQENLISRHLSADGTLVRANASFKSFVPIEVAMDPDEYKKRLRSADEEEEQGPPQDPGNPTVDFRGEKRGNKTHRSMTDPDCRFVSKGSSGTGAYPGYTVNALMENRNRILVGVGVEIFRSSASEEQGALELLDRAKRRFGFIPKSLGADKGFFHEGFIEEVFQRRIQPHIAADTRGSSLLHRRVRMRQRGMAYRLSQRCRKKIEELFGEGKEFHGLRRFRRRKLYRVREETWLIGWVLNLKRLAKLLTTQPALA